MYLEVKQDLQVVQQPIYAPIEKQEPIMRHLYSRTDGKNLCGANTDDYSQTKKLWLSDFVLPGKEWSLLRCPACVREYKHRYNQPKFVDPILVQDMKMLRQMLMILDPHIFFSFDTETDGLDAWCDVAGFSIQPIDGIPTHAFYVSWNHQTLFDHNVPHEEAMPLLKAFFEDKRRYFLGHNMAFDLRAMWRLDRFVPGEKRIDLANIEDSQVPGWLVNEQASKALKQRAFDEKIVRDVTKLKDFGKRSPIHIMATEFTGYTIQDVTLPQGLYSKFIPQLQAMQGATKDSNLLQHYTQYEIPFIRVLAEMTHTGIRVDAGQVKDIEDYSYQVIRREMNAIYEIVGESYKITDDNNRYYLFEKMGLEPVKWTSGGNSGRMKPAVSIEVLEVLEKQGHPIAKHMAEYARAKKFITSFTKKLQTMVDYQGRIHTNFNNTGTDTGRLCVAGDTVLETSYGQIQIQDLDLGSLPDIRIKTHRGRMRKIKNKFYKGKEAMYQVTLNNEASITCTAGHRFWTPEGWKHLHELEVGREVYSYVYKDKEANQRGSKNSFGRGVLCSNLYRRGNSAGDSQEEVRCFKKYFSQFNSALRRKVQGRNSCTKEQKLFQSNERQQSRGNRITGSFDTSRGSRAAYLVRKEVSSYSSRTQNNRVFCATKRRITRNLSTSNRAFWGWKTSSSNAGSRFGVSSEIRTVCSRNLRDSKGVLHRPRTVLREGVRGVYTDSRFGVVPKRFCSGTSILSRDRKVITKSYSLVDQSIRNASVISLTTEQYSAHSRVSVPRKMSSRFFLSRYEFACRVRRGISRKMQYNKRAGFVQASASIEAWLSRTSISEQANKSRIASSSRGDQESFVAKIVAIDPVGIQDVWDIEVEEDHSYLAQGFVNHNSSSGPNLQNIPRDPRFRAAFIPAPGKVFVIADYGQLELRMLAHFCQDPIMVDAFKNKKDLHSITAALAFMIPVDEFIAEYKAETKFQKEKEKEGITIPNGIYQNRRHAGKCLHPDTWLETENGFQRIGSLGFSENKDTFAEPKGAQFVRKPGGQGTKIIQTYNNGIAKRWVVVSRRGVVVGSENHRIQMEDGSLKPLCEVKKGDAISRPFVSDGLGKPYVHNFNPWFDNASPICSMEITNDWAYLLGAWTGDGAFSRKCFSIVADKNNPEWFKVLEDAYKSCGLEFNVNGGRTCIKLGVYNTKLFRLIKQLGFASDTGKTFRIPEWLMNSPAEIKKHFLGGLVDTDGTISKNYREASYTTKDVLLAQDVCILLQSLGIKYSLTWDWNKTYLKPYYTVSIHARSLPYLDGYIRHPKKKTHLKEWIKGIDKRKREDVWYRPNTVLADAYILDEGPLVDISIEDPHMYLANGFATHNTVNFGIVYGGGAKKLGVDQSFIDRWKRVHATAANYIAGHNRFAKQYGITQTLAGRYRRDRDAFSRDSFIQSSALRGLFSAHIQGSAADIVKKAMIDLRNMLVAHFQGAQIVLQVHDEIVVECWEKDAELVSQFMQHCMENAYPLNVPLEATPSIGMSWAAKK